MALHFPPHSKDFPPDSLLLEIFTDDDIGTEVRSEFDDRAPNWYISYMTTTLFMNGRSQAVRIPKELRLEGREVTIRRMGDGLLLVPVKASSWPLHFFESIRIDDENFSRPEQGELPPVVDFGG